MPVKGSVHVLHTADGVSSPARIGLFLMASGKDTRRYRRQTRCVEVVVNSLTPFCGDIGPFSFVAAACASTRTNCRLMGE